MWFANLARWCFGFFPRSWRRWLDLGVILCTGAFALWCWVDSLKKDAKIAEQKVEYAGLKESFTGYITLVKQATDEQKIQVEITEKKQNEISHSINARYDLMRHGIADAFRVLVDMSKAGNRDSGCELPRPAADTKGGDNTISQQRDSREAAQTEKSGGCADFPFVENPKQFYQNALMDNISVQTCRAYTVEHNIPVLE